MCEEHATEDNMRKKKKSCISFRKSTLGALSCWQCSISTMYMVDDDFTRGSNIVYKYLCINGFYTSKLEHRAGTEEGARGFSQKEWKKVYSFF